MTAFRAAARKIEKMIVDCETGNTESSADDLRVFNAINKLEDRIYKEWRADSDDASRAEKDAALGALRARMRAAIDTGFKARQDRRYGEISASKARDRERIANMTPDQRANYNYQQELKLRR